MQKRLPVIDYSSSPGCINEVHFDENANFYTMKSFL